MEVVDESPIVVGSSGVLLGLGSTELGALVGSATVVSGGAVVAEGSVGTVGGIVAGTVVGSGTSALTPASHTGPADGPPTRTSPLLGPPTAPELSPSTVPVPSSKW